VLASASPARRALLRAAGLEPEVVVSGVGEDALEADLARQGRTEALEVAVELARAKARTVADALDAAAGTSGGTAGGTPTLVIGCDSVLDLDGRPLGKPTDAADAVRRWHDMRGRSGRLRTGHTVVLLDPERGRHEVSEVASTLVHFADLDQSTIEAYVATGEPLHVAGAFTLDGLGGPFVEGIEGDPSNVVGLSLPLLRRLLAELGIPWHTLWSSG
jgi:septum formation protein